MKLRHQTCITWLLMTMTCLLLLMSTVAHGQRMPGTTLVIAVTPTFNIGALLLAQEKGIFRKHGLDATIIVVSDPATILKGVYKMEYDIGYANVISNLQAIDRKHPIVLLHPAYAYQQNPAEDPQQLYVMPNSKIKTTADMATAKIGVPNLKEVPEWSIRKILDNQGITDHSKITWHQTPAGNAHSIVLDGTVDGVWLKQPDGNRARAAGLVPAFSVTTNAIPGATGGYYYTSKRFAMKYWDITKKFQTAMTEANFYATQYPSHNRETLAKYLQLDRTLVDSAKLNKHTNDNGLNQLKTIIADAVRYGLIKQPTNTDQLFWKR
jgi:NitT/TauT family transport system substrate-binding protein